MKNTNIRKYTQTLKMLLCLRFLHKKYFICIFILKKILCLYFYAYIYFYIVYEKLPDIVFRAIS